MYIIGRQANKEKKVKGRMKKKRKSFNVLLINKWLMINPI